MADSPPLVAPQLVINSRMLYSSWIPADPEAAAALLPAGVAPAPNRAIYMNQYVVDDEAQTSGFGAYSLTYLGLDLAGLTAPDGATPGRFFTHYLNSSERMRAYASERGVPAAAGSTTLEQTGPRLVATTHADGKPVIRTTVRAGHAVAAVARGHLLYVSKVGERLVGGHYPYVGEIAADFEVQSIEFLDPSHPVYALRPKSPLEIVPGWCWYAIRDSFVYPGGEFEIKPRVR